MEWFSALRKENSPSFEKDFKIEGLKVEMFKYLCYVINRTIDIYIKRI